MKKRKAECTHHHHHHKAKNSEVIDQPGGEAESFDKKGPKGVHLELLPQPTDYEELKDKIDEPLEQPKHKSAPPGKGLSNLFIGNKLKNAIADSMSISSAKLSSRSELKKKHVFKSDISTTSVKCAAIIFSIQDGEIENFLGVVKATPIPLLELVLADITVTMSSNVFENSDGRHGLIKAAINT